MASGQYKSLGRRITTYEYMNTRQHSDVLWIAVYIEV